MVSIRGVYEIAVRVRDLPRAEAFYCDVLGLEPALRDERRNWLFMRAGGDAGMVVLQEDDGDWPAMHFAFTVADADLEKAQKSLEESGVAVVGPVHHAWMGARSLYFADPDGHELELCAPVAHAD